MKELPIYKIFVDPDLDDNSGVYAVSLVEKPAIQTNFIYFEEQKALISMSDDEKRIVTGVLLRPDILIYRNLPPFGEMYWTLEASSIETIRDKFHKQNNGKNVTVDHKLSVEDCYLIESYIVDRDKGLLPAEFSDIEDGSWVVSYKIENDEVWNAIKIDKSFKGFSVEGVVIQDLISVESAMSETKKSNIQKINEKINKILNNK